MRKKEERKVRGKRGDMRKRLRSEGEEKTVSTKLHVRRREDSLYQATR